MTHKLILVACGGAVGSVLRYLVSGWGQRLSPTFPIGTLIVNMAGCAAIGFLMIALTQHFLVREEYRIAIIVGVLGGFTTFSAFGYETFAMIEVGAWTRALVNVLLSNVLGIAAVWIGARMAERYLGG